MSSDDPGGPIPYRIELNNYYTVEPSANYMSRTLTPPCHAMTDLLSSPSPPAPPRVYVFFGLRFPIFQPQCLKIFTTLGVTAAVSGTRMKMKLL